MRMVMQYVGETKTDITAVRNDSQACFHGPK